MGKVKQEMMKNKPSTPTKAAAPGRSTAMARPDKGERERRQAAIQALTNRGYDAIVESGKHITLEETGNLVKDKDLLIGIPFLIVDTNFTISKQYGTPFVTVTAMLQTNEVVIFNDGSTGICKQLDGLDISPDNPLWVPNGLRVSRDYDTTDAAGNNIKGTTYYLSAQASTADIKGLQRRTEPTANGRQARFV